MNPMNHKEAAQAFEAIKFSRRSAEIMSALNKMVLPAMKARVEAMKAMLADPKDLEAIENEFSNLKRDYKEAYAEEGVKAQIVTAQPEPVKVEQRSRLPMTVKDIFLLYKDGRFISHHTNRVVSKEQQKELFADLKVGRDLLRSPKYLPQKLNIIPGQSRNILVQSGRFTVVIIVAEGSVDPWSEKITTKVITLMEKEDQVHLKDWNGDVSALKSSGKYMQALLFAFMKLANKGKQ
jgi:predicted RNA-binding protein (virulence factor B family)